MEEKIRVNLSKRTYNLLMKDAENFEFFKKDGSLNKNAFINRLIINYQNDYSLKQREMLDIIEDNLFELNDKYSLLEETGYNILNKLNLYVSDSDEYNDVHISFRPIRESLNIIDFIEHHELKGSSRSNYYRMMFDSYCSLPQDKRERIIFRNLIEKIEEAILDNRKIYLLTKNNYKRGFPGVTLSPFSLSLTKEELYNYLLAELNQYKACRSTRLCRIQSISILKENREFSEDVLEKLNKMEFNGPQYAYTDEENELIKIQLSEEGIKKFKQYYVHRPVPIEINNDIYVFNCTYTQALNYFARFGEDAIILSPDSLKIQFKDFYQRALEKML